MTKAFFRKCQTGKEHFLAALVGRVHVRDEM